MTYKAVKLEEDTKQLLNTAKGLKLLNDPGIKKLTDNSMINEALALYVKGVKNGSRKRKNTKKTSRARSTKTS